MAKIFAVALVGALVCLTVPSTVEAQQQFLVLKLSNNIQGASTTPGVPAGSIDLVRFEVEWETNSGPARRGTRASSGSPALKSLTITKHPDSASDDLINALWSGTEISEASVQLFERKAGGLKAVTVITMQSVRIT